MGDMADYYREQEENFEFDRLLERGARGRNTPQVFEVPEEWKHPRVVKYGATVPIITVSSLLQNPARLARMAAQVEEERVLADKLFPGSNHRSGPAIDVNAPKSRRSYAHGRQRRLDDPFQFSKKSLYGCICLCHYGFGGEHPNQACGCKPVTVDNRPIIGVKRGRLIRNAVVRKQPLDAAGNPVGQAEEFRGTVIINNISEFEQTFGAKVEEEKEMDVESRAEMLTRMAREKVESAMTEAEKLEAEAARLRALPKEPAGLDDGTNVIYWQKVLNGSGKAYTYAALKTPHGWYVTGKTAPQAMTWDALVQWIGSDAATGEPVVIWSATAFEALS